MSQELRQIHVIDGAQHQDVFIFLWVFQLEMNNRNEHMLEELVY